MIRNSHHNLIHQLSETMDSLWRMGQYIKDAQEENRGEDAKFWMEFRETLEKQVEMLKEQLEKAFNKEGL